MSRIRPRPHFKTNHHPTCLGQGFQYDPCTYNKAVQTEKHDNQEKTEKQQVLCRDKFRWTSSIRKMKFEDAPFVGGTTDYSKIMERRNKWLDRMKILHGPFYPSAKGRQDDTVLYPEAKSRKSLMDIIRALHRVLVEDWQEATFSVVATMDDFIIAAFESDSVDSVPALGAYMGVLERNNPQCRKFLLSRVKECWGSTTVHPGQIWYMLRPPWVSNRFLCDLIPLPQSAHNRRRLRNSPPRATVAAMTTTTTSTTTPSNPTSPTSHPPESHSHNASMASMMSEISWTDPHH